MKLSLLIPKFLLLASLTGCIGEKYSRYAAIADCDRPVLTCLNGDCYYCYAADSTAAIGCLKTHWPYILGTDPLADVAKYRPDVIYYGNGTTVTITMLLTCSDNQEKKLRLYESP